MVKTGFYSINSLFHANSKALTKKCPAATKLGAASQCYGWVGSFRQISPLVGMAEPGNLAVVQLLQKMPCHPGVRVSF